MNGTYIYGGSPSAVRFHYDAGRAFYRAWLDETMTYSCALWEGLGPDASLEDAQQAKLNYHANNIKAKSGSRVLDVGCGWGSMLTTLSRDYGVRDAVGLTLSHDQHDYVRQLSIPGFQVHLESWADFEPSEPFDGIISICALEQFADHEQTDEERLAVYHNFFETCARWLKPGGRLSLQTIAYGTMDRSNANSFIQQSIFPDAELPRPWEILRAADGIFEVTSLRSDRLDYARTCEEWAKRLKVAKAKEIAGASPELIERYERYLRLSAAGFRMGRIVLLRMSMSLFNWTK